MRRAPIPPRLVAGALAVLTVTAGAACRRSVPSPADTSRVQTRTAPEAAKTLDDVGRQIGLVFPPGSRLVGVERERGQDDLIAVKVEMKLVQLAPFLDASPVKDFQPGERGLLGSDHAWWDPGRAPRLRTGQANLAGGRFLNIGVDDSRTDVAVLYIVNHGT